MRALPPVIFPYLKRVEAVRYYPYQDSTGTWTVGVGHTGDDVEHDPTVEWSDDDVNTALTSDLGTSQTRAVDAVGEGPIDLLNDNQYAALLSFIFNVGEVASWQIFVDMRAGDDADVPAQLERFVFSHGVKLQGLVNRRGDDVALWNGTAPECAAFPASTPGATS
jgi:lysozyme